MTLTVRPYVRVGDGGTDEKTGGGDVGGIVDEDDFGSKGSHKNGQYQEVVLQRALQMGQLVENLTQEARLKWFRHVWRSGVLGE